MSNVVFLRGVNIGGHKLKPKELADSLKFVNIGAAGTFIAPKGDPASIERAIAKKMSYEVEVMICSAEEIHGLIRKNPFATEPPKGAKPFVTVLHKAPKPAPKLPLHHPDGELWEVRVSGLIDRFVISHWRRLGDRIIYPNPVIEKAWKVPGTTRGWDTILKVATALERG